MMLDDAEATALLRRLANVAFAILHDEGGAQDVAQEAVLRVIEHGGELRAGQELQAWAYAIAINLCRNQLRKKQAKSVSPDLLDATRHPRRGPATSIILRESVAMAAAAVSKLSDPLREVFVLHYLEGLPYEKIAEACGITLEAARVRALRARAELKAELALLTDPEVRRRLDAD